MDPVSLEAVRSRISTVGVFLSTTPTETEVLLPAKGVWGGIKRGIVYGAAMPVMIGFIAPIPGGTFIGVLASPLGAIVGGIHGISTAVPAEEVEHAETMLRNAEVKLQQMGLREKFVESVIALGNARTTARFVAWPLATAAPSVNDILSDRKANAIDTRLEIGIEQTGLRGRYSIDPPTETFVIVHARLIRSGDNAVLMDGRFVCASEEERTFADWADGQGSNMVDEFKVCVPALAEKIIDDLFLVYPVKWNGEDSK